METQPIGSVDPRRPPALGQGPVVRRRNLKVAAVARHDRYVVTTPLHQRYVVGRSYPIVCGAAVSLVDPVAPEALRRLHPIKAVPRDRVPKLFIGSAPEGIGHRHGQRRRACSPDFLHDFLDLSGGDERPGSVVNEHDFDPIRDAAKGVAHGCLAVLAPTHDGRTCTEPLGMEPIGDVGHLRLRHRHHNVTHHRVLLKQQEHLHEQWTLAEHPELLGSSPHPTPPTGRRDHDGNLPRIGGRSWGVHAGCEGRAWNGLGTFPRTAADSPSI